MQVLGKMKDETAGLPIIEFIGLRPKMYSFQYAKDKVDAANVKEKHVAKGIQRAVIADLRHEDYRRQLEAPIENHQVNRRIGARLHEIYAIEADKRGLCGYDDKRYMLNNIESLAYGHHRIPVQHIAVDMHPDWTADNGMIVLAHDANVRKRMKRKLERIAEEDETEPIPAAVADAAEAAPGADAAEAAPSPAFQSAWDDEAFEEA